MLAPLLSPNSLLFNGWLRVLSLPSKNALPTPTHIKKPTWGSSPSSLLFHEMRSIWLPIFTPYSEQGVWSQPCCYYLFPTRPDIRWALMWMNTGSLLSNPSRQVLRLAANGLVYCQYDTRMHCSWNKVKPKDGTALHLLFMPVTWSSNLRACQSQWAPALSLPVFTPLYNVSMTLIHSSESHVI